MTEQQIRDVVKWGRIVEDAGKEHGLNPALMDFWCEYVSAGVAPEEAAVTASEACEITTPITKR